MKYNFTQNLAKVPWNQLITYYTSFMRHCFHEFFLKKTSKFSHAFYDTVVCFLRTENVLSDYLFVCTEKLTSSLCTYHFTKNCNSRFGISILLTVHIISIWRFYLIESWFSFSSEKFDTAYYKRNYCNGKNGHFCNIMFVHFWNRFFHQDVEF